MVKLLGLDESFGVVPRDFDVIEIVNFCNDVVQGKNKRKSYEVSQNCQDAWATQHLWNEMIRGTKDTTIHYVKYVICSTVKGTTVSMGPKFDTLEKHAEKILAMKDLLEFGVKKDKCYISKNCWHLIAAKIYNTMQLNGPTILDKVQMGFEGERARKIA